MDTISPRAALSPGIFVIPAVVFKVDNSRVCGYASLFRDSIASTFSQCPLPSSFLFLADVKPILWVLDVPTMTILGTPLVWGKNCGYRFPTCRFLFLRHALLNSHGGG